MVNPLCRPALLAAERARCGAAVVVVGGTASTAVLLEGVLVAVAVTA